MKRRRILLGIVAAAVGLPVAVGLGAVGWIQLLDETDGELTVGGRLREYRLHVPDSLAGPAPLVVSFHAGATWPAHQENLTGWSRLADEQGFLVVYPAGSPQFLGAARIWRIDPKGAAEDVEFVAALLDRLAATYPVDATRIYLNGMSNGADAAFAVSCALAERVAAVGLVAAARALPETFCAEAEPVPLLAVHGTADPIAPYPGGRLGDPFNPVRPVYPPVREWVAEWARRNGCAEEATEDRIASDVVRLRYDGCGDGADVELDTVLGGGHSWPGGKPPPQWRVGPTSTSFDATSRLWSFFQSHPRRRS